MHSQLRMCRRAALVLIGLGSIAATTWLQFSGYEATALHAIPTCWLLALLALLCCPIGALACLLGERRAGR